METGISDKESVSLEDYIGECSSIYLINEMDHDIASEDLMDMASDIYIGCQDIDLFKDLRLLARDIPHNFNFSGEFYFEAISVRHHSKKVLCIAIYSICCPDLFNTGDGNKDFKPRKRIILPEKYSNPISLRYLAYYYASKLNQEWGKRNNINSFCIYGSDHKRLVDPIRRIGVN